MGTNGSDQSEKKAEEEGRERPEKSMEIELDGPHGRYSVTASTVNLKGDDGKDRASVFSVAYVLLGADPGTRPVTFCFNGGPGSSAIWLQFGAFGPKRVDLPDEVTARPGGHSLVDNEHGLLDLTDMVFIDPVGTGFSRAAGTAEATEFHAVKSDVESVGEFIWRWLSRNGRWASPKLLAGESYGTTRAGALALYLSSKGVALNGLVLVSVALDFQTFVEAPGHILPHVTYLPSLAATAAYHGRVDVPGGDLDAWLADVRRFATDRYAPALLAGASLSAERKAALAEELSAMTGLAAAAIARRHLRIGYLWFARSVLGEGERTIGRLDGRYVGADLDPTGTELTRDPSMDAAMGAYTAAVNDFLRREVGFDSEEMYEVLSMAVNQGWQWDNKMGFVDTSDDLRKALIGNPHLRVLFANGLYDLATPFFAAEYTASQLQLTEAVGDRIELTYYPAGHMMYFHPPSLAKLKQDLVGFFERVVV
jgi:carboxypeptidase C (cathepsin A)